MIYEIEDSLRKLKSHLNDCIISKENAIAVKKKELTELNYDERKKHYSSLEKELGYEEELSHKLKQDFNQLDERNLKKEWNKEIETKKLRNKEEKAEALIESFESKIQDTKYYHQLKREREEKPTNPDLEIFKKLNERCKGLEMKKQHERDALKELTEERCNILRDLQEECKRQHEERKKLEKCFINADLGISLHKTYYKKEEIKKLRLEEDILKKEVEERKEIVNQKEKAKKEQEKLEDERQVQIRVKEKLRSDEKKREREYIQLLTEVMAEEEGLHLLRYEIANRKRREHFIAAQMILDERRKRRKENKEKESLRLKEQKELTELRNSVLEEEERRLLLAYLPHIGPFLSSYLIQKLSSL